MKNEGKMAYQMTEQELIQAYHAATTESDKKFYEKWLDFRKKKGYYHVEE